MKVAVFLSEELPDIGGGHTFNSEIFHSILKLETESNHTFVVCGWSEKTPSAVLLSKNIQYLSISAKLQERREYKFSAIQTAVLQKLRHPRSRFKIEQWHSKFLLNTLVKNGIDIIWHLRPDCITMELPYITTVWDLQHRMQPYFPEVSIKGEWNTREQAYATMLKRASFIITGTEAGKMEVERLYQVPEERIRVIPFPTPRFTLSTTLDDDQQIFQKYNLPQNYLFYPAQFWSHKNHAGLLLAVKWLKDKYNLIFPVVFTGSDKGNKEYIRKMADELELSKQVHFLGFVSQEDLTALYRNAFALTFVTFFGPDNLPPLEAFALECPVIASKVSGAQEQLGNAALLVDPKEPEQIALAIKSLWDDTVLRQTLVERGLIRASKWTGKDYVKGVFSLLDEFAAIRRCWSRTNSILLG
ncbi:glycosyltransferase family 1 protein [Brasilonema sp. UFV-L1]|uniref:glycosyltransferase family 4 protein n=1 Tax=Brasilonema sp. UFV-L1 TaxID=2234130 RepID=UPI00145DB151|nr:glycosyltransferase family 1 protein [Brasilonema sp. UFV-L1]NMG10050.1 glycosyltransferase family 1 protein [Brasilonema sp. UFV-L1]